MTPRCQAPKGRSRRCCSNRNSAGRTEWPKAQPEKQEQTRHSGPHQHDEHARVERKRREERKQQRARHNQRRVHQQKSVAAGTQNIRWLRGQQEEAAESSGHIAELVDRNLRDSHAARMAKAPRAAAN